MRLFEFEFPRNDAFLEVAGLIHANLESNYGVAGGEYIRQLVIHQEQLRRDLPQAIEELEREFQMQGQERFWSQAAALALYGGKLARAWGIIEFDPERVRAWLATEIKRMRGEIEAQRLASSASVVLADYLNAHVGERLVISTLNKGLSPVFTRPTRALSQHYERDIKTMWIARKPLLEWLRSQHYNVNEIRRELIAQGILLNPADKKILGKGTDLSGSEQTWCWKIQVNDEMDETLTKEPV
jgi:hypothetical protein